MCSRERNLLNSTVLASSHLLTILSLITFYVSLCVSCYVSEALSLIVFCHLIVNIF